MPNALNIDEKALPMITCQLCIWGTQLVIIQSTFQVSRVLLTIAGPYPAHEMAPLLQLMVLKELGTKYKRFKVHVQSKYNTQLNIIIPW